MNNKRKQTRVTGWWCTLYTTTNLFLLSSSHTRTQTYTSLPSLITDSQCVTLARSLALAVGQVVIVVVVDQQRRSFRRQRATTYTVQKQQFPICLLSIIICHISGIVQHNIMLLLPFVRTAQTVNGKVKLGWLGNYLVQIKFFGHARTPAGRVVLSVLYV